MIVTFLRSSSYGTYSFCPFQYYLNYTLGLSPNEENGWKIPKPQHKADLGSCTHKALELLAQKKVCLQENRSSFTDAELGIELDARTFDINQGIELAWEHYSKTCNYHEWTTEDYKKVRKWSHDALLFHDGEYNPLNRNVIWPEKHFEFEIKKPWAKYRYELPDGQILEGHLGLKGTVDLVCQVGNSPTYIELIDWKTGERKDWATGKEKDWASLREDPQLRLYHYALSHIYPQAKHILITIVYIRTGGPFSLPFDKSDLPKTERMLEERFNEIRSCEKPKLIYPDWRCQKLCSAGLNNWKDSGKTVCQFMKKELQQLGMERTTAKYADMRKITEYGSGGGLTSRK